MFYNTMICNFLSKALKYLDTNIRGELKKRALQISNRRLGLLPEWT